MAKPSRAALATAVVAVAAVGVALSMALPSSDTAKPEEPERPVARPVISLHSVSEVRPAEPVRLTGQLKHADPEKTTVTLQRRSAGRWVTVAQAPFMDDESYVFLRQFGKATSVTFRAVAQEEGQPVAVSPARKVTVLPATGKGAERLPDLGARKLTDCPASEQPCFWIEEVEGRRWLRFPVTAVNVGEGPLEIHGHRSTSSSSDWIATRRIYHATGDHSEPVPGVTFFYARDEHDHWHIKDFHTYQMLDKGGTRVRRGEKEAFCFEDNTNYRDWRERPVDYPRVPRRAVYTEEASCGEGNPLATSLVHGLSRGWGDTYPTTLPDQGVDITDLGDGVYTVSVKIDTDNVARESNERNNTVTVVVRIKGDRVTPDPRTATGL